MLFFECSFLDFPPLHNVNNPHSVDTKQSHIQKNYSDLAGHRPKVNPRDLHKRPEKYPENGIKLENDGISAD